MVSSMSSILHCPTENVVCSPVALYHSALRQWAKLTKFLELVKCTSIVTEAFHLQPKGLKNQASLTQGRRGYP